MYCNDSRWMVWMKSVCHLNVWHVSLHMEPLVPTEGLPAELPWRRDCPQPTRLGSRFPGSRSYLGQMAVPFNQETQTPVDFVGAFGTAQVQNRALFLKTIRGIRIIPSKTGQLFLKGHKCGYPVLFFNWSCGIIEVTVLFKAWGSGLMQFGRDRGWETSGKGTLTISRGDANPCIHIQ